MKRPLIRKPFHHSDAHGERGVTMVLVAISMVAIIAMAAWSIDLVTLYLAREEAQRSADAAALTAARIISVSGITGTASGASDPASWSAICGASGAATLAAQSVGGQNSVGQRTATVTVNYAAGPNGSGSTGDCSSVGTQAFAVNPLVTVKVQQNGLATFFSRIWGYSGNSISATATAEVFNPSASDSVGTSGAVTPVQPRCVKPWMVPNQDPYFPSASCSGTGCSSFVSPTDGQITHPGISLGGTGATGVIGETFTMFADCNVTGATCTQLTGDPKPVANSSNRAAPNLEYVPGQAPSVQPVGVPACGNANLYQAAVAGCDQSTQYQCGTPLAGNPSPNAVDLGENPAGATGDTATALACSLPYPNQAALPLTGLDVLDTTAYPFKITTDTANPLRIPTGTQVTSSNQIVSLPIYDGTTPLTAGTTTNVVILGFLQVFINNLNADGSINVTVLNVAGCGSATPNTPVNGSSPVPIRLITPPS